MRLVDRLAFAWRALKGDPGIAEVFQASLGAGQLGRPRWSSKDAELVKRYTEYSYACINRIADACAQQPLGVYYVRGKGERLKHERVFAPKSVNGRIAREIRGRRHLRKWASRQGELIEVGWHPILDLFLEANDWMDGYFLAKLMVAYLCLTGKSYVWMLPGPLGPPDQLFPLPVQWTQPVIGDDGEVSEFRYGRTSDPNTAKRIPAEQIAWHRHPNPQDVLDGYAPLAAIATAHDLYEAFNLHETVLLDNGAEPGGILTTGQSLNEKQRKELRATWESLHRGPTRAGRVAVLDRGLEWKATATSPKELGFLKGRPATVEEMAAGYGVPLSILRTENVNRANAEVGLEQFARFTVKPILILLEQKWNQVLCPQYDERLFVAHADPVPEDRTQVLEERKAYVGTGILTINEVREELGREPVEGGDVPLVPALVTPLGGSAAAPSPAPPPAASGDDAARAGLSSSPPSSPLSPPGSTRAAEGLTLRAPRAKSKEGALAGLRGQFLTSVLNVWRRQAADVLAAMPKGIKATDPGDVEAWLFGQSKWERILGEDAKPFFKGALFRGGQATMAGLPVGLAFDVLNPHVLEWLDREPFKFAAAVNDTTASLLRDQLKAGLEGGESYRELRKRVEAIFGDRGRADLIVNTEMSWAYGQGELEAARQSGVVRAKVWRTLPTACELCLPYRNMQVDLDEAFIPLGGRALPGAESGRQDEITYREVDIAERHPRCQCWTEWVLLEEFGE